MYCTATNPNPPLWNPPAPSPSLRQGHIESCGPPQAHSTGDSSCNGLHNNMATLVANDAHVDDPCAEIEMQNSVDTHAERIISKAKSTQRQRMAPQPARARGLVTCRLVRGLKGARSVYCLVDQWVSCGIPLGLHGSLGHIGQATFR